MPLYTLRRRYYKPVRWMLRHNVAPHNVMRRCKLDIAASGTRKFGFRMDINFTLHLHSLNSIFTARLPIIIQLGFLGWGWDIRWRLGNMRFTGPEMVL